MRQTKKIESIEQLSAREMAYVKGGFSFSTQNSQSIEEIAGSSDQEYYIYIDGKRYRLTSKGVEPA